MANHLLKSAEDFMTSGGDFLSTRDVTAQQGVFALADPAWRDILAKLIRDAQPETALLDKRFPWPWVL